MTFYSVAHLIIEWDHRYTRKVPEPVPFWSRHGVQIEGIQVFSKIKITVVRQMGMSPASTSVWAWRYTRVETPHCARMDAFVLRLLLRMWSAKTRVSLTWAWSGITLIYLWVGHSLYYVLLLLWWELRSPPDTTKNWMFWLTLTRDVIFPDFRKFWKLCPAQKNKEAHSLGNFKAFQEILTICSELHHSLIQSISLILIITAIQISIWLNSLLQFKYHYR